MRWVSVPRLILVLSLGLMAGAAPAASPGTTNILVVPDIVVTASRTPREASSEPFAVRKLDAVAGTGREAARTMPDLLRGQPSVMLQKTAYGQGSPYLRGFTGFRTLCLVDGVPLNNSVFRDGPNQYWNTVDALSLRDVELVLGPGSVLYGSDAIGGVLNALSVDPPAWNGKPEVTARGYYRGATAERSNIGRAQAGARASEQLGCVAGVSLKSFGDLQGGRDVGRQEHTGYDELDVDAKGVYAVNPDTTLTLAQQSVRQDDAWRTHRTIYGLTWEGLSHGDDKVHAYDQDRDLTYLKFRTDSRDGPIQGAELTLSRHAQSESLHRIKTDDKREQQGFDVTTWGAALQLESASPLGQWVYGASSYYDEVGSYSRKYKADGTLDKKEIQGPVADDAGYESAGAFVQDTLTLWDGALDLTPGVRYTYAAAEAGRYKAPLTGKAASMDDHWQTAVGSLRGVCPLTHDRRHVLYGGISQGFRAPNLSDLTRLDTARSDEIETAAPDLDPERYVANEIGFKSRLDWLESRLAYYYTTIDGMIVRTPTGREIDGLQEVTKQNSGDGYVQGVEWEERVHWTPAWSTWFAAGWMDGKVDTYPMSTAEKERDYLSRLMPPTAQIGCRWESPGTRYWAELVGDMATKADKLSADDRRDTQRIPPGGTPGYVVGHVRAGTRLNARMELAVAIENILDEDYRIHGSGVNEPGRNVILTAQATF